MRRNAEVHISTEATKYEGEQLALENYILTYEKDPSRIRQAVNIVDVVLNSGTFTKTDENYVNQ